MNTKTMKVLVTVASVIMLVVMLSSVVFADSAITPGSLTAEYKGTDDIAKVGKKVMGIVNTVGVVVAVVILMVLGIKYMMGSAEEKAEYKKTLMPYVIGAALVFAASTIAGVLYGFLSNV